MKNNGEKVLYTKWGTAKVDKSGYYVITTCKEGFNMKSLHRLIYEEYYGQIPDGCVIHHRNENKLDNRISNLELMSISEHRKLHTTGKTFSAETKRKISQSRNSSGYLNVCKQKNEKCRQGFNWMYRYYDENGKRKAITSVSLEKLEQKVRAAALPWEKFEN